MASENDMILLSCLPGAPAAGDATSIVRSALQRVIVRPPPAAMHNVGHIRTSPGMAGARRGEGTAQQFRAFFSSAHTAVVDGKFLRAFTATRARIILAGLTPLPVSGRRGLPTVVAGVADSRSGLCFLGQRANPLGFSAFSIQREYDLESVGDGSAGQSVKIGELMHEHGRMGRASASALYDLWGTANGDNLGGCSRDGAGLRSPLAHLATVWDCSSYATRTLGSPPPPACSSLLVVGGVRAPRAATLVIRRSIEMLTAAAGPIQAWLTSDPLGCVNRSDGEASTEAEERERVHWNEELEALLSCSENMAEYAMKPRDESTGGDDAADSDTANGEGVDDTAIQERKDGSAVGTAESGAGYEQEAEIRRTDSDFSEKLWELAARRTDVACVRSAISSAFYAVGEGRIFPVVSRDNQTAIGRHIRSGVLLAREARYDNGRSVGVGVAPDEARAEAWRERGFALVSDIQSLADAFVELGVYKVTRDLLSWLETHAGVVAADIDRAFPLTAHDKPSSDDLSEKRSGAGAGVSTTSTYNRRLDRLITLADTVDLVALAQSYGAPWRQVRALAHAGLSALGRAPASDGEPVGSSPSPVFPVVLPRPIPARARSKLAHPIFWELLLEPTGEEKGDNAGSGEGAEETVSYAMMDASVFQLKGVDEPLVLSGGAARLAQEALEGCPAHLIPEVLSSVAGVDSFAQLKRRQKERREQEAVAVVVDDAVGVFACKHRFIPWK